MTDIQLSWTKQDNNPNGEWRIYRSQDGSLGSEITGGLAPGTGSYTDSGAAEGRTYYYTLRRDTADATADSAQVSIQTALPAPQLLTVDATRDDEADLSWALQPSDEDGVHVYRRPDGGSYSEVADLSAGTEAHVDTGLLNGQEYDWYVAAYTDEVESGQSNAATGTTTLPDEDQPVLGNGVEAEVAVDREEAPTNNGSVRIQIRETGESSWDANATGFSEFIGASDTLTIEFTGREDGEEYEVRARTETAYRTGAWTEPVAITTKFPGATALTATVVDETTVDLAWTDNADNEDGQRVIRERRGPDGDWWPERVVGDAGVNAEAYTDDTAQPDTEYRYRIQPYTEHTTADSNADTATTDDIGLERRRVPASGWRVEIDTPSGDTLLPTVLSDPELSRPTNGLPSVEIPVPPADRWRDDTLKGQPMRVWKDGVQQPIDEFESVSISRGSGGSEMRLIGSGGSELDQYVDDIRITEQETDEAMRDTVDTYTGYGRNIDDPETDTRADVQMLLESGATISDVVVAPDPTDPYRITQLRGLHNRRSGQFVEAEDATFTGVQVFADAEGNAGAWSGGEAIRLSDVGDRVETTINPTYEIPGGDSRVGFLWAIVGSESPAISIELAGNEVDAASKGAIPLQASDKFDLNWSFWNLSNSALTEPASVAVEITEATDADIYVDVAFPHDARQSYLFDETPVDGELDGPQQFPEVSVETVVAQSVEQVVGGAFDVDANTADGLGVAVSNDGTSFEEAAGTSVSTDFASASQEIRGRIDLGRWGGDEDTGLAAGANGHEISEVDLRANLRDTPVLLDKQPRGRLYEVWNAWADDADAIWTLRRDPDAAATDPTGMIVEWTLAGQRTRTSTASLLSVDGSETIEGSYDQVVVFGSSQSIEAETFVANDPGQPRGLDEAWVKVDSERVTDPSTGERFSRGEDYVIRWKDGAIEIVDSGAMRAGTTYEIDYDWRYRGEYPRTDQLQDPTGADVVEDQIPAATSNRECEQLALGIYKRVQDPLVEATVSVSGDAAEPSILASLSHHQLPFDDPLKIRERMPDASGSVQYRLANRDTAGEIVDQLRDQFSSLADRV